MKTVAVIGVGLIGGSFALALRKAGFQGEILGVSSNAAIEAGTKIGAISHGVTLEKAAAAADLIYLSQPVDQILRTLELLGPLARNGSLITDAGSTKTAIVAKARACVRAAAFLGGHPLAGKEQRGADAADAELFQGRAYILTPAERGNGGEEFRFWLRRIGANIFELTPEEHDTVVAFTSHLPQLLSTTLSNTLAEQGNENFRQIFGPGLLDMTRLAMSSPELWLSILKTNQPQVLTALEAFAGSLSKLQRAIKHNELRLFFDSAFEFAQAIREPACRNVPEL